MDKAMEHIDNAGVGGIIVEPSESTPSMFVQRKSLTNKAGADGGGHEPVEPGKLVVNADVHAATAFPMDVDHNSATDKYMYGVFSLSSWCLCGC